MGYARTQAGAIRRLKMKKALRALGYSIPSDISNALLVRLYRRYVGKAVPKYVRLVIH